DENLLDRSVLRLHDDRLRRSAYPRLRMRPSRRNRQRDAERDCGTRGRGWITHQLTRDDRRTRHVRLLGLQAKRLIWDEPTTVGAPPTVMDGIETPRGAPLRLGSFVRRHRH